VPLRPVAPGSRPPWPGSSTTSGKAARMEGAGDAGAGAGRRFREGAPGLRASCAPVAIDGEPSTRAAPATAAPRNTLRDHVGSPVMKPCTIRHPYGGHRSPEWSRIPRYAAWILCRRAAVCTRFVRMPAPGWSSSPGVPRNQALAGARHAVMVSGPAMQPQGASWPRRPPRIGGVSVPPAAFWVRPKFGQPDFAASRQAGAPFMHPRPAHPPSRG